VRQFRSSFYSPPASHRRRGCALADSGSGLIERRVGDDGRCAGIRHLSIGIAVAPREERPMSDTRRIARVSASTLHREVQGEAVLLQLDSGEYFGLDTMATRIWQLIVEKGDLAEVEAALLDEFDVDPATLSSDLQRFVGELAIKQLIETE
jgi:coenzyme PQQ synthesis protein D (PqqD)